MAETRHKTGNSRPRQFTTVSTDPVTKRKPRAKGAGRKPGPKKTTGGRVSKTTTAKTTTTKKTTTGANGTAGGHHRRKATLGDKVKGAAKKAAGTVERKPGKKAAGSSEMRGHDGKHKKKV